MIAAARQWNSSILPASFWNSKARALELFPPGRAEDLRHLERDRDLAPKDEEPPSWDYPARRQGPRLPPTSPGAGNTAVLRAYARYGYLRDAHTREYWITVECFERAIDKVIRHLGPWEPEILFHFFPTSQHGVQIDLDYGAKGIEVHIEPSADDFELLLVRRLPRGELDFEERSCPADDHNVIIRLIAWLRDSSEGFPRV